MQTNIGVERALPGRTSLSVNVIDSRGVHTLLTRDINAPGNPLLPSGALPYPGFGPIYQYETAGLYKQIQYITNVNTRFNRRLSLQGYYALGFAHSNASGFPMNQYDLAEDWGRASFDVRHRGYIGGVINLPYAITASPFITMQSGFRSISRQARRSTATASLTRGRGSRRLARVHLPRRISDALRSATLI